jgi:basic amino acid/polyamine antiporter, APA family
VTADEVNAAPGGDGAEPAGAAGDDANDLVSSEHPTMLMRTVGVPWLFAVIYGTVGFSIYFALGVVADRGLGFTPVIFLIAGLLFVLTTLTYMEGGAMIRERGGSSTFARYAFNEFVSFAAGWAILIDLVIVIALAAISVPHYLEPISGNLGEPGFEVPIAGAVIAGVAVLNIIDVRGRRYRRMLAAFALADVVLQLAVLIVGAIVIMHPDRLTDHLHLFSSPDLVDIAYATVVAMLAYTGIEAASNLAPDIDFEPRYLRRIVATGALAVPLIYAGMAAIALMAVPVVAGPDGLHTALGDRYVENPVLGVVSAYDPAWLSDLMRWTVALIAAPVLCIAAYTSMLGVSRHIYTLAINRQIPSWLGKLGTVHETPYVAIIVAAVLSLGLVIPTDVKLLAGIYAFGAMLAITIAHLSIVRLRITEPDWERPFRGPGTIRWHGYELPGLAIVAAVLSSLAFVSVLAFHGGARWVGGGWMAFGLISYVVYRRLVEETSLTKRVSVTPGALTKQVPSIEYNRILVPVFGTKLDDDIVATAGRLAAADEDTSDELPGAHLDVIFVVELPLSVPLDARLPSEKEEEARKALMRAKEVGEEYESVEVHTEIVPARSIGSGIVEAARRTGAEAIVMGAEPPTRIRGGAVLGGVGAARPDEVGAATEYVLKKAPCRVLLTAPPEAADAGPSEAAAHAPS